MSVQDAALAFHLFGLGKPTLKAAATRRDAQEAIEGNLVGRVRRHVDLRADQIWQVSDPRRLSAFRVVDMSMETIVCQQVTGTFAGRVFKTPRLKFYELGTKGYMRVR